MTPPGGFTRPAAGPGAPDRPPTPPGGVDRPGDARPPRPAPSRGEPPYAQPPRVEPPSGRRALRDDVDVRPEPVSGEPPSGRRARRDESAPVGPPAGRRALREDVPGDRRQAPVPPPDLGARLGGPTPTPRPRPTPPPLDADATRYTNAFSGSLPPPPGARPPTPGRRPRPPEPPTEIIAAVEDRYDDYDDEYHEDDEYYDDDQPPPAPPDSTARKTVRTIGELLITAGLVILLFVVYEIYVTDLISAGKQDDATQALDDQWGANTIEPTEQREIKYDLIEGQAFAKMYIPVFGPDYRFSIVEGTTDKHLEIGPGHYVGTALPGEPGNFSVAGHRVGKGAPFNDLDLLNSCDAIVVETQTHWFVYRVLPKAGEAAGWAERQGNKKCEKVSPLGAPYDKVVGQEIVLPTEGEVISEVPHYDGESPPVAQRVTMMTLTTCHPRFSDKQRLIVHAVLVDSYPKAPDFVPDAMKEEQ